MPRLAIFARIESDTFIEQGPVEDGDCESYHCRHSVKSPIYLVELRRQEIVFSASSSLGQQERRDHDYGEDRLSGAKRVAPIREVNQPSRVAVGVGFRLYPGNQPGR